MKSFRQALGYCLHKIWIIFAIAVVLMAAFVSALRLGLPYAPGYKADIEDWIQSKYNTQVKIGALSAAWQGLGPALVLQKLEVLDSEHQPQLNIDEVGVRLDFWKSLTSFQLSAADFQLRGLTYHLEAGRWLGSGSATPHDNQKLFSALQDLFFKQLQQFSVINSRLVFNTEDEDELVLEFKALNWQNDSQRHQGWGEVSVPGVTANTLSFIVDLHGEAHEAEGQLYLTSKQLDLLPWFQQLMPQTRKLNSAKLNFAAWGEIKMGKLQQIDVALADNNVGWHRDGVWNKVALSDGFLRWKPTKSGWSLTSSPLTLSNSNRQWPELQLQLSKQDERYHASLQNLQLQVAEPLLQLFALDNPQLQALMEYQIDAKVDRLDLLSEGKSWTLSGQFSGLNSAPVGDAPGVQMLSGQLLASEHFGWLTLAGKDAELRWGKAFSANWPYQGLEVDLAWRKRDGQWQVLVPTLSLWRESFGIEAELAVTLGESASMDLIAELHHVPALEAEKFYPLRHMPKSVIDYLKPALQSGDVSVGKVLWSGELAKYPYEAQDGTFQALATVVGGEFQFDKNWPSITELAAELFFENASMTIQSQGGFLIDVPLEHGVVVSIDDLRESTELVIDIRQQVLAEQVTTLMQASPLDGSVGAALAYLNVSGPIDVNAKLAIGLYEEHFDLNGSADFLRNDFALTGPILTGENLTGRLKFHNDQIEAQALNLFIANLPMEVSLRGANQVDGYQVSLLSHGQQSSQHLLQNVAPQFDGLVEGDVNWQFKLDLQLTETGYNYRSDVSLDFTDTELRLASPYQKNQGEHATLFASTVGNQDSSALELNYQDKLFFEAEYLHQESQVSKAHLSLGPKAQSPLTRGFSISAALEKTEFLPLLDFIQRQVSAPSAESSPLPSLSLLQANLGTLEVSDGLQFENVSLEMTPSDEHWQLKLESTQTKGIMLLAKDLQVGGIAAELEYLRLFPYDEAAEEARTKREAEQLAALTKEQQVAKALSEVVAPEPMPWLADLPPLSLNCGSCEFGPYNLGELKLKTHADGTVLTIEQFESRYKDHILSLAGAWVNDGAAGRTLINAELRSPNMGQLLQDYALTSAISGSSGQLSVKGLSWTGGPTQFNFATLAGDVNWRLGAGSLSEVNDKGARLLSVFSLGSLVRKLKLDFRDLFSKGFFFTEITGDLKIDKGVAHTNNSKVEGAAGNVEIQGYADLVTKQLDYQMAFLPKVTSSIPVLLALLQFNPVTGLAALAIDGLVESAQVISKVNFAVTGTYLAPVVTEVARHTTEIDIPRSELLKAEQARKAALLESPSSSEKQKSTASPELSPTVKGQP